MRIYSVLVGIFCAGAIALWLSPHFSYLQAPSYAREKIGRYELYSPLIGETRKHVVIGSCEVSLPMLANDIADPAFASRNGAEAWLGNVVNYVLRNDLGDTKDAFFDISAPNTILGHHAIYLYHALKAENLKSILYMGGVGLSHAMSPGDALEAMAVAESFERTFPAAKIEIENYKQIFRETPSFREGEKKYGADWRRWIDSKTLTLTAPNSDTINATFTAPPKDGLSAKAQFYGTQIKERINTIVSGPAYAIRWLLDRTFGIVNLQRDAGIRHSYEWAKAQDFPSGVRFARIDSGDFLDGEENTLHRAWFEMVAAIVKAKGARLVIYSQPMLTITPGDHRNKFKPKYSDRLAGWLAPYDPIIIDHTVDHDLAQSDFIFECKDKKCVPGNMYSPGYWANLPGRIKQARLLASAMRDKGLLAIPPESSVAPIKRQAGCVIYANSSDSCYQWQ